MTFDFIHIGLAKCMSTTLQTQWARSSNYRLEPGISIARGCEQLIEQHANDLENLPSINVKVPDGPDGVSVISGETLTYSYWNKPHLAHLIPIKQQYAADSISHLSRKVLIVVRDPIRWIHSAHAQSINLGGFESPQQFIQSHKNVLLQNLNLGRLLQVWQQKGLDITVLSMEGFSQEPEEFWQCYESSLGVSRPSHTAEITGVSRNASRYDRLELAAHINHLQHRLAGLVDQGDSPDLQDKEIVMNALDLAQRWGARRALHTATDAEVASIQALFNPDDFGAFHDFTLDPEFIDHLEENYVTPLSKHPALSPYLPGYRESLAAVR
jgi:hypothetical protein